MTTYDTGQNDSEMGEEQLQNTGQTERNQGSNESQSQTSEEITRHLYDNDPLQSILFTMEVEDDSLLQDDEIATILTNHINNFAQAWKETNQIIGVVLKNCYAMLDGFHETEEWCYEPRII